MFTFFFLWWWIQQDFERQSLPPGKNMCWLVLVLGWTWPCTSWPTWESVWRRPRWGRLLHSIHHLMEMTDMWFDTGTHIAGLGHISCWHLCNTEHSQMNIKDITARLHKSTDDLEYLFKERKEEWVEQHSSWFYTTPWLMDTTRKTQTSTGLRNNFLLLLQESHFEEQSKPQNIRTLFFS